MLLKLIITVIITVSSCTTAQHCTPDAMPYAVQFEDDTSVQLECGISDCYASAEQHMRDDIAVRLF
jgi:hypothetical protein